jgi:predicted kinase
VKLIVFSGLPGTGKSALAETIGRESGIPVFAYDWLMGVIEPFEIVPSSLMRAEIGYGLLTRLAQRQLLLGQSALLDCVVGWTSKREEWRQIAAESGASFYAIETICSDEALHRARLEGRTRGIPGWHELTWADIERSRSNYQAWTFERLVVDAVHPLEQNLEQVRRYLGVQRRITFSEK